MTPRVKGVRELDGWVCGVQQGGLDAASLERQLPALWSTDEQQRNADPEVRKLAKRFNQGFGVDRLHRDVVAEFLALHRGVETACRFVERHGIVKRLDTKLSEKAPDSVASWWRATKARDRHPFAVELTTFWERQEVLRRVLTIQTTLQSGDRDGADRLARNHGYTTAALALQFEILERVTQARIGVRVAEQGTEPFLITFFVEPGIYAHLWNQLLEEKPFGACLRCGAALVLDRPGKVYCSKRCQEAAKQLRFRERLGAKPHRSPRLRSRSPRRP